ncbi:MAG: alpha/beta fold hydrolase [Candidatus Kapaibacterium sp.]
MKRTGWLGETVRVGDVNLYYESHGEGEPLLCVHNFSSNSRTRFAPLLPVLAKKYKCYLIDLRGHGRSDNPTNDWTKEQFSRDIIGLCKELKINSAYFLAASSGGMAMLRVARYAPDLVRAMVIDSATYKVPRESQKYYRPPESLSEKLKEYYKKANEIYGPEYWHEMAQAFYNYRLHECDVNIPLESLKEIISPTLIIHGDSDIFFPVNIPAEMKMTIPNSELAIFPNTQHIVMEFYPERIAEMAVEFFERQ